MTQPKILAFAGSLRKGSYNKKLIQIAAEGAREAGASVTVIDLLDYPLPLYDGDWEQSQGLPENALKLKELFLSHDGFLISSPEYNSSISGVLKNTIDWVSRPAPGEKVYLCCFIDKAVGLLSASPGALGGLRGLVHVRSIFQNVGSIVIPKQKCIPNAAEAFDEQDLLKIEAQKKGAQDVGASLAHFLEKFV